MTRSLLPPLILGALVLSACSGDKEYQPDTGPAGDKVVRRRSTATATASSRAKTATTPTRR